MARPKNAEWLAPARRVVRLRQNCYADMLDAQGYAELGYQKPGQLTYDWKFDVSQRWFPSNGVYRPQYEFQRRLAAGEYVRRGYEHVRLTLELGDEDYGETEPTKIGGYERRRREYKARIKDRRLTANKPNGSGGQEGREKVKRQA